MEWVAFNSFFSFLEMFTSCYFASSLFYNGAKKKKAPLVLILFAVLGTVLILFREYVIPWVPDFVPAILTFSLYAILICRARWWTGIAWAVVNYLFIGIVAITVDLALRMFSLPYDGLLEASGYFWVISCILTRIGQLLLAEIVLLIWKKFPFSDTARQGSTKTIMTASVSIILLWLMWTRRFDMSEDAVYSSSLVCLLILAINFTFLFFEAVLAREKHAKEELKTQNRLIALQIQSQNEVNNMYQKILSMKHDINNHLHTISGYMQVEEYAKAQHYVEELAGEVGSIKSFHSGNTMIDVLIGSKTAFAEANFITVKTDLSAPPELNIEDEHLAVMIGNLYDNAIDANLKIQDTSLRFINIRITFDNGNLLCLFENAAPEKDRLATPDGWTSTKKDAAAHGFGIKNIGRIVQMYDGYCERELKNHVFRCRLRIPCN